MNIASSIDAAADRPTSKRIRFQESVRVRVIDCEMTREERALSFYSNDELKIAQAAAVGTITSVRSRSAISTATEDILRGDEEPDPVLRGMERYVYPNRRRNKEVIHKVMLKYQAKLKADGTKTEEEKIRLLGACIRKFNMMSMLVAIETARHDSLQAYGSDYLIPISKSADLTRYLERCRKGTFKRFTMYDTVWSEQRT